MPSTDKITFYNDVICPAGQRVAIALKEVDANYEVVNIDLKKKPTWLKDISPEMKVPVIRVDGTNIVESIVILEYISDRYPEKKLLPEGALQRAQIRFAIDFFRSKISLIWYKFVHSCKCRDAQAAYQRDINAALKRFEQLLLEQSSTGPYFLGEQYSLADIAIAPFFGRLDAFNRLALKNDQFEAVKNSPRLAEFFEGILHRPSFKETFVGEDKFSSLLAARFSF